MSLVMNDFKLSMPIVVIKDYCGVCVDVQVWKVWWVIKQGIIRVISRLNQIHILGFTTEDFDGEDLKMGATTFILKSSMNTIHMAISRRLDTQSVVYSYSGMVLSNNKGKVAVT